MNETVDIRELDDSELLEVAGGGDYSSPDPLPSGSEPGCWEWFGAAERIVNFCTQP